jgi:hypothetical protein
MFFSVSAAIFFLPLTSSKFLLSLTLFISPFHVRLFGENPRTFLHLCATWGLYYKLFTAVITPIGAYLSMILTELRR